MNKLHSKNKLTAVAPSFLFFFFLLAFFSRQLSLRLWRSMKAKMRIDDQPLVMRCLPISQIVASRCYRCHSHLFKFNSMRARWRRISISESKYQIPEISFRIISIWKKKQKKKQNSRQTNKQTTKKEWGKISQSHPNYDSPEYEKVADNRNYQKSK